MRNGRKGVELGVWHQNSWAKWGVNGRGWVVFPMSVYQGAIGGWWAIDDVTSISVPIPPPI